MICTKVVIIRGLFSLFTEYFRRIVSLFTEFALFVFSSKVIIHCLVLILVDWLTAVISLRTAVYLPKHRGVSSKTCRCF